MKTMKSKFLYLTPVLALLSACGSSTDTPTNRATYSITMTDYPTVATTHEPITTRWLYRGPTNEPPEVELYCNGELTRQYLTPMEGTVVTLNPPQEGWQPREDNQLTCETGISSMHPPDTIFNVDAPGSFKVKILP